MAEDTYTFDLIDPNGDVIYEGSMEDSNANGSYTFSIDLSVLTASIGTYSFQTRSIDPVIGGENPQSPLVIKKNFDVKNYAPEALEASTDFE